MGIFTKDIKTMNDLFLQQLEDIYYAEQQLTKAIPKMADLATNADLKAGLKSHVIDTQNQIERLDKASRSSENSRKAPTARPSMA
jgi:ferritin-like metal-binding protein YciE